MTRFLMAVAAAAGFGATARAGGPPPVYVVADEVIVETSGGVERVTIRGSFVRLKGGPGYVYDKPVEGVVYLSLDPAKAAECRAEWKQWEKAAGTGKVVPVGMCGEAGAFLKVKIHKPGDNPAAPDATYTPGHLGTIDPPAGSRGWADESPVKALVAFAKDRKEARPAARPARP